MNLDEQILKRVDKQMLIQLVNENVKISTQLNIQKGQFLLPFFFACLKSFAMSLQCLNNVLCFREFPLHYRSLIVKLNYYICPLHHFI